MLKECFNAIKMFYNECNEIKIKNLKIKTNK